jgi:hypothetical protein
MCLYLGIGSLTTLVRVSIQVSNDGCLNTVKFNGQCNDIKHANSNTILILNGWHKASIASCQIFGAMSFHQLAISEEAYLVMHQCNRA